MAETLNGESDDSHPADEVLHGGNCSVAVSRIHTKGAIG